MTWAVAVVASVVAGIRIAGNAPRDAGENARIAARKSIAVDGDDDAVVVVDGVDVFASFCCCFSASCFRRPKAITD